MSAKRVGTFWNVKVILTLFIDMGCELNVSEPTIQSPDGDCWNVRYLLNRATGVFVPIVDLDDDHVVSAGEVADWERRLDIIIPKPPEDGCH